MIPHGVEFSRLVLRPVTEPELGPRIIVAEFARSAES